MRKIIVSVAPVSAADTTNNPEEIAKDVINCYKAGANMVHLHCRDKNGQLTEDLSVLHETVGLIKQECPIVVEISTGGVSNLNIVQRTAPCWPNWVECNSLNVGSVNLGTSVYQNPIDDVNYCVKQILKYNKTPEVEVFEIGMIYTAKQLLQQFNLPKPMFLAIVLGHHGAMPATDWALDLMLQGIKHNFEENEVLWGITHAHRKDWAIIEKALDLGAMAVRIGFEDSNYLNPLETSPTNAAMIEHLVSILPQHNVAPATPDEVRAMLCIK